ncbi:uncharacterized protein LOC114459527 [Gouania willdenowi]|nr:uncharacterized protein LOC114459527 [Gouania willdenowi]XP_028297545.1 uncharacterized protein LOC114459527 [Gouania willdenowi]
MIPEDVVDAICKSHLVRALKPADPSQIGITLVESLTIEADAIPENYSCEENPLLPVVPPLNIKEKQYADPCIREVMHQLKTGEKVPPTARAELPELPFLLREWSKLDIVDGVLYRRRRENESTSYQVVLPAELRPVVLKSLHDDMGHMGIERTLDLVRTRFYWPKMALHVEQKVQTCGRCVRRKALPERAAPLVNISTSRPLELLCMDFLSLEPDSSNTRDILVLTDHFTKFALAFPTPNQKATTVAKCLWENFIIYYGIPERIHTDQGRDFESKLIKELCEVAGIQKSRTSPYHPRGNPVERFNRTLLSMLGTLENKQKSQWKQYVKPLVHAYNCTKNEVTGFTPYELMFGRTPRLPVDLACGLPLHEIQHKTHTQYVQALRSRLKDSFDIAAKNASHSAERNKTHFDKRVVTSALEAGDRVLVRNVRLRGKHKLSDKWEQDIYVVLYQVGELPVYKVKPETGDGPVRTLHRDLLLPCRILPVSAENLPPEEKDLVRRPITRQLTSNSDSFTDHLMEEEDAESVVSLNINPPTRYFTVERIGDVSVPSPNDHTKNIEQTELSSPLNEAPASMEEMRDERTESEEALAEAPLSQSIEEDPLKESTPLNTNPVSPEDNTLNLVEDPIRRSNRRRAPPVRFQYATAGNPLINVVQTLLHSLSDALNILNVGNHTVPSVHED